MLNRFHSVVIEVEDFGAAIEHYAVLLGCPPTGLGAFAASGPRCAFFKLANMNLEICAAPSGVDSGAASSEGLRAIRLAIEPDATEDVDAVRMAVSWLAKRGVGTLGTVHEIIEAADGAKLRQWHRVSIEAASSRGLGIEIVAEAQTRDASAVGSGDASSAVIRDLDHVVVFSGDAEATRAFYQDGLDLRLALDKSFEDRQVRLLFFRLGGVTIEIGSRLGAEVKPGSEDRFGGLAWEVVDADAIRERLLGEGFDVGEVRTGNKPGTRVCTVRSPVHGVPTLLIQPVSR